MKFRIAYDLVIKYLFHKPAFISLENILHFQNPRRNTTALTYPQVLHLMQYDLHNEIKVFVYE